MVEPQPSKLMMRVRFPLPAPGQRQDLLTSFEVGLVEGQMRANAHVAQLVEHTLGKGEVGSSSLLMSSRCSLVWVWSRNYR